MIHTQSEIYTQQILEYFEGKPKGTYAPYDVRMDLDISAHAWRWYATRYVYPEGSKVRAKLKDIGVEIETVKRPVTNTNSFIPTSTFVVSQRKPAHASD